MEKRKEFSLVLFFLDEKNRMKNKKKFMKILTPSLFLRIIEAWKYQNELSY